MIAKFSFPALIPSSSFITCSFIAGSVTQSQSSDNLIPTTAFARSLSHGFFIRQHSESIVDAQSAHHPLNHLLEDFLLKFSIVVVLHRARVHFFIVHSKGPGSQCVGQSSIGHEACDTVHWIKYSPEY